jgi:PAS domain S-box-containing protein
VVVNGAAARFVGKSPDEIVGKHDLELYDEETARRFIQDDQRVLATGQAQSFEGVATGEGGAQQAYLVTKGVYRHEDGAILGIFGISHDITELRQAHETIARTREALFRSQKMEAVGQLTGGIAHDFNNILAVVLGNAELLKIYLTGDVYAEELIDTVLRATLHARELTSQLLAFSRGRQLHPQPVDVNGLVAAVVRLIARTLGETIRIETLTSGEAGVAFVDAAALEAAVLNIALNARDAMPEGGSLTIRTSRVDVTNASATDEDLKPGAYAVLALEDTGVGMPPEVIGRAFEPFFTTKTGGRGTGLGLSMVYGFARQSGGTVTIESAPGRGTTIRMFLPIADGGLSAADAAGASDARPQARTILVVEDEADVRNTVRRQLESLGHRVLVAEAAKEALLLLQIPDGPEVLITDVVLASGMNGIELAKTARAARPGLPVVFMSGYAAVPEAQREIHEAGAPLLSKPFSTPELERAVYAACAVISFPPKE